MFCPNMFHSLSRNVPKQFFKVFQSSPNCSIKSFLSTFPVALFGAAFSKGQSKEGPELAPKILRQAGLVTHLKKLGHEVRDFGDLRFEEQTGEEIGILKNPRSFAAFTRKLAQNISERVSEGFICLTVGGDHSIALGSVYGHVKAREDVALIWIDAHADVNTATSTRTGHLHGMPVSFLLKEMVDQLGNPNAICPDMDWLVPCLASKNLAYIGLRDVDEAELRLINNLGITCFTMQDVDKLGIYEVINRVLDKLGGWKRDLHVSFDIDAVDEFSAPSTGTPVPGGLTLREAFCIGEEIAKTKRLRGFDLVEVNPLIGSSEEVKMTVNSALNIALSFFGKIRTDSFVRLPTSAFQDVQLR